MEIILISIFALGYLFITLEHSLKIDKLIPALGMMALLWALISLSHLPVFEVNTALKELEPTHIDEVLLHHLGKTAEILIFLLGAMTIVEIIDYFNGFFTIKSFIKTTSKKGLLYIFAFLAFILSAIIDNLTATIVLITILQKVVKDRNTRLWFAGLIVICANAGGAWSPIGDVTTTMLWIGKKVSTVKLISYLLIPSIVCAIVPVIAATFLPAFKGARPYRQAYNKGVKLIGATSHYVTEELDEGPIIEQDVISVSHHHSVKEMIQAGRDIERRVLTSAVIAHLEYRIILDGKRTIIFHA